MELDQVANVIARILRMAFHQFQRAGSDLIRFAFGKYTRK
jgi:hypothetical protein